MADVSEDKLRREIEEDERKELLEEEDIVGEALMRMKIRRLKTVFACKKRQSGTKKGIPAGISESFEKGEKKLDRIRQKVSERHGIDFVREFEAKVGEKEKKAKKKPEQILKEKLRLRQKLMKGIKLLLHPMKLATGRKEIEPLFGKKKVERNNKEETAQERRVREQTEAMAALKKRMEKSQ